MNRFNLSLNCCAKRSGLYKQPFLTPIDIKNLFESSYHDFAATMFRMQRLKNILKSTAAFSAAKYVSAIVMASRLRKRKNRHMPLRTVDRENHIDFTHDFAATVSRMPD